MTPLILIRDPTQPPRYITHFLYSRVFPVALPLSLGISLTYTHFLSIAVTPSLFLSQHFLLSLIHTTYLFFSLSLFYTFSLPLSLLFLFVILPLCSLNIFLILPPPLSLSLSLSLSLTHTHTHTLKQTTTLLFFFV